MQYVFLFLSCIVGGMIQGTTGFGFGIFVMAVLPFFLPVPALSVGVAILASINCFSIAFQKRHDIKYSMMLVPTVVAFIGRFVGIHLLMRLETGLFQPILGVVLIVLSLYFIFWGNIRIRPTLTTGIIAGFTSGILGGTFNTGGPPLVIYYLAAIKDKDAYIATIQATFLVSSLFTVFLHGLYGRITLQALLIAAVGFVAVVIGSRLGLMLFSKLNPISLRKVIYGFMMFMGILMIGVG